MSAEDRLVTGTSGVDTSGIAPKRAPRSGLFGPGYSRRDIRRYKVQTITLTGFAGVDSFTLTHGSQGTTAAFVRQTNATAAAIQAELRTLTGDSALTVSGTTDEGPFVVTFSGVRLTQGKPIKKLTVNGTGCTGVATPEGSGGEALLGTSRKTSAGVALTAPSGLAATPTNAVGAKDTITVAGVTAGDSFKLSNDGGTTKTAAFVAGTNMTTAAIQAALRTLTGDSGLTVGAAADDVGPWIATYTVVAERATQTSGYTATPQATLTAAEETGMTATVARTAQTKPSVSIAYTEQATHGDSVFVDVINDNDREDSYHATDAASPVVVTGLRREQDYTAYFRTVSTEGRVSAAVSSVTFDTEA